MSNKGDMPAFPGPGEIFIDGPQGRHLQSAWGAQGSSGMTLRQWYAGQALANGVLPNNKALSSHEIAKWCFDQADAMLEAEREKIDDQH